MLVASLALSCGADDSGDSGSGAGAASTGAGGSGGSCADPGHGTLAGTVYLYALPPDPAGSVAPNATLHLRTAPTDTPIDALAGADGLFSVDLAVGGWLVGAENADGCISFDDDAVTITPCGTTTLDVIIDACPN